MALVTLFRQASKRCCSLTLALERVQQTPNVYCILSKASSTSVNVEDRMNFSGFDIPFTSSVHLRGGAGLKDSQSPIPCYRTIDNAGKDIDNAEIPYPFDQETAIKIYRTMLSLQTVDTIFYEAQRQGRFSFYMTSAGEEAISVASAAAISPEDVIFMQYREQGALMSRGFTMFEMANQCYGNEKDPGKGRQMPIHYGSRELNCHTVSSPLATQLPHAVGAAYALKIQNKRAVAVVYFGEGAASEGDFHAAMNFASTLSCPVIFICRNNGWAISTPAKEQYRGDGIAGRGSSYDIPAIRVDGGDAQAVFCATAVARKHCLETSRPVLIEAMSYRMGHHSTSDDSSRYRAAEEIRLWYTRDPVGRMNHWLQEKNWWDEEKDKSLRIQCRKEAIQALDDASKIPKAKLSEMFTDVYDEIPPHLETQMQDVFRHVAAHPGECPEGVPIN